MKNKKYIVVLMIIFAIVIWLGYQHAVKEANVIFPVDTEDVFAITVREYSDGVYSSRTTTLLSDNSRENLIDQMNALQPVWDGNKIEHYITWFHKYHFLYEVVVRYIPEKSKLRYESAAHIYYADNGVIVVDCGGFTKYQTESDNYDSFLLLLEQYAEECFVSAE